MSSVQNKLRLSIGGLVLLILAFVVFTFPRQQREIYLKSFASETGTVTETLALAIGIGLNNQDFEGMRRAFEYAKQDAALISIAVLDANNAPFAVFPQGTDVVEVAGLDSGLHQGEDRVHFRVPVAEAGGSGHQVVVTRSLDAVNARVRKSLLTVVALSVTVLLLSLAAVQWIARSFASPIETLGEAIQDIAQGRLEIQVDEDRNDEVGALSSHFNSMTNSLRGLVLQVRSNLRELSQVAESLDVDAERMASEATLQKQAVEGGSHSIIQFSESAKEIGERLQHVAGTAQETSASIVQMDTSIREVGGHMEHLSDSLDGVSSGSTQLVTSVRSIVDVMESLDKSTEETNGLLTELSATAGQVGESANRCGAQAREVSEEAQRGADAVGENISAMSEIRDGFEAIRERMVPLKQNSKAVGGVLEVIESIADQTGLLALNASIIAAQAGENGAAFAVVATQVKELAQRTAKSTSEIAALIDNVDRDTTAAVEAVSSGSSAVGRGEERSNEVAKVLSRIVERSSVTSDHVNEIVASSERQLESIHRVDEGMTRVGELVQRTNQSTHEQHRAASGISVAVEKVRDLGQQVRTAMSQQSTQSRLLTEAVEQVSSSVGRIHEATQDQDREREAIDQALSVFRDVGEKGEARSQTFHETVTQLVKLIGELEDAIRNLEA